MKKNKPIFFFNFVHFNSLISLGSVYELVEACLTLDLLLQLPIDFSKYTTDWRTRFLPVIGLQFRDDLVEQVVFEAVLVLLVATRRNDKIPSQVHFSNSTAKAIAFSVCKWVKRTGSNEPPPSKLIEQSLREPT